ncbi:DUF3185 family protein [Breznakiella homolactica]|uniref:DUF3185 family protein n=1 Tax=Breznakiella homolactica TaxID=2798577 RepID=A0A7T8BAA3_9SPIR|nr:DUF3185 family protein [Breznakiella homolactica]QQO09317.1 DUF3185 family protein [Breznakiella homolactica]
MNMKKIVGLVVLIVGVAVLAYGIYQFVEIRQSLAGKISGMFNKQTDGQVQSIIMMVAGGVAAAAGLFITVKN